MMILTLCERSSALLRVGFKDEDGTEVQPTSVTWRIDDASGSEVRPDTVFAPSSASHDLQLTPEDTRILDQTSRYETRLVAVTFAYGSGRQGTAQYKFRVVNLLGIGGAA